MPKLTKSVTEQQDTLPIPLASLVIDLRTIKDDLLETLQLEIANLASEKQERGITHWQHLADFTAFKPLTPMGKREIDELWARMKADRETSQHIHAQSNAPITPTLSASRSTIGSRSRRPIRQFGQRDNYPPFFEENEEEQQEQQGNNGEQRLNEEYRDCELLIDQIRNERHNAISDLGTTGRRGYNTKDPRVHVIFITDARQPDSLASASAYAAYLKQYYRNKLAHLDHDPVLTTTVLCLNQVNTTKPPENLIQRLRWIGNDDAWEHINTLIVAEKYREDAGWQDETMQTYIAELLLYSLLIMTIPDLEDMEFVPNVKDLYPDREHTKERIGLPPHTYLFGLSAIEHSARWGRRFLNTTLGLDTIEQLQSPMYGEEGTRTKDVVDSWLSHWLASIQQAIPIHIPPSFPSVGAFDHANNVAARSGSLFIAGDSGRNIEARSIQCIEQYTTELAQTYYLEASERDAIRDTVLSNTGAATTSPTFTPTLQDAVNNIDPILSYVARQRDDEDTPFIHALHAAQRVLSHHDFFLGAQGAISRAKMQLEELSDSISEVRQRTKSPDLAQRRDNLMKLSKDRLVDLQALAEGFPILRAVPWLIIPIMWISLIILAFFGIVVALTAMAWLYHLADAIGGPSFLAFLNLNILGTPYLSVANIVLVVFVILLLLLFFYLPYRLLHRSASTIRGRTSQLRTKRQQRNVTPNTAKRQPTALTIELLFIGLLIVAALFGLGVSLSLPHFPVTSYSYGLLSWLSWLPFWSYLLAVIAILLVLTELVHYFMWRSHLLHMRTTIVDDLTDEQQETVRMIQDYHALRIALDILRRAELTDGQGGKGDYYRRISQLSDHLDVVAQSIKQQQHVARNRLTPPSQQATLLIRKELLDVNKLATHTKRLEQSLQNEPFELHEFADVLLRVMGTESPEMIERQLRDQDIDQAAFLVQSYQDKRSLRHLELLMTIATAIALRLSVAPPQADVVEPLDSRNKQIAYTTDMRTALQAVIANLREWVRKSTIDVEKDLLIGDTQTLNAESITIQALVMWTLVLWMHKNAELEDILRAEDITVVLARTHDAKTVRDLLGTRLNPSGRTAMKRWIGDLYVLTPPTASGRRFIQNMDARLRDSHIVSSPDNERLIMLYFQHHVTPPRIIIDEVPTPQISTSATSSNGNSANTQRVTNTATIVDGDVLDEEPIAMQVPSDGNGKTSPSFIDPVNSSPANGHSGNTVQQEDTTIATAHVTELDSDTSTVTNQPTIINPSTQGTDNDASTPPASKA